MNKELEQTILDAFAKEVENRLGDKVSIETLECMTDLVNALYVVSQKANA